LIVDTAGRLGIDDDMMAEISAHAGLISYQTLLLRAMTGSGGGKYGKSIWRDLPLTGVILTKTDGDARGGARCLFVILRKPIKFLV